MPRRLMSCSTLLPVLVAAALAVAVWLRLASVFAEFPSGDGGLFWVMANDLRNNGFIPPAVTTYNTGDIPWVYPPLGLYLVAALGGGLEWFRIVPALFAIATLPAVWLLARALIGERGALIAVVAQTVTAEQRELMEWAAAETPEDATFAVIDYPTDRGMVEWFPALSGRENVTTWQGASGSREAPIAGSAPRTRRPARRSPVSPMRTITCCDRAAAKASPRP